jgi:hypothetical protein
MTFLRDRLPDPASFFEGEGLTLKGPGKWKTAECEFHGGSDSMRINTESGGWCCMNCGVKGGDVVAYCMESRGLDFVQAAQALGAWQDDGKPSRTKPLPFSARDALAVIVADSNLIAVARCGEANGVPLSEKDRQDLLDAAARIRFIAEAA